MTYAFMTYALMTCALMSSAEEGLSFKFQPGDKYFLVSSTERRTTRVVDANEQVAEQSVRFGCDFDIEEVEEDGSAWARYTYRTAAMKIKNPGVDVAFDSDANQSRAIPPQALPLALALGEGFYVKITPRGRIDRINGLQDIISYARGKIPQIEGKQQIMENLDNQFAEAGIRQALESCFAVFPDACPPRPTSGRVEAGQTSLDVGDSWSRTEQQGNTIIEQTWRIKSIANGIAIIDVNIIVGTDPNAQDVMVGNTRARREISGQGAGQMEIEQSSGRIINSSLTEDLVEEIRPSAQGLMLRPPPAPEPTRTRIITTFQMLKREPEIPPASPDERARRGGPASTTPEDGPEQAQPNQPVPSKAEGP